ncbi:hypothetical protein GWK47_041585 [Chionoecetes opilio]|uniref:Uncharacterized protein n=1 Tax=Chionoecetes opilio TaxID=41210 RepID=A0A8J5D0G0_CHIOP|nr:hypothetical protein GWK47_041585 [Chionoecetes opilio]
MTFHCQQTSTLVCSQTLAWDNIDRLEETLSGAGTSHRVNGIAVQFQVAGSVPEKVLPEITKSKIRSITLTASIPPIYNVGRRAGPPKIETAYVDTTKESRIQRPRTISGFLLECQTMRTSPSAVGLGSTSKSAETLQWSRTL